MQHHGIPTRLLDWTESFSTALFFALEGAAATSDVDIWMLNPYGLNEDQAQTESILDVESFLKTEYFDLFIEPSKGTPEWAVIAIYPRRQIARLASQHGLFTLHSARMPLENIDGPWLTRFHLKQEAVEETNRLLKVLGVNDFSLFPDLDGLSRFLRKRIKGGYAMVA